MIDVPTQPAEPIVYVNGAFLPQSQASISVFDHAVLYGDGVFDTSCAWNGYIFMLDAHLDRLYRSIQAAKLAVCVTKDELKMLIVETVRRNGLLNAYIKVVVSRGVSPEPLLDPRNCIPGLIIFARPYLSLVDPQKAARGLITKITSVRRIPPECLDPKIKSLNYLNLIMAKLEAIESGCDDAIMLDTQGYVSEGPGYNIFAVVGGNLITPSRSILEGITRTAVFLLAERLGLKVTEGFYTSYDLYTAEEVFFCSTAGGIIPITCIDGRTIGSGEAGTITTKIRSAYRALLESGEYGTAVYPAAVVSADSATT
jgi:branched-chain amino acid aminotransferase